jgi:8-oxo-dGTP pyrophosphatase MutT (NUDIX family)/GNAT superfamily N-acetyltransferase
MLLFFCRVNGRELLSYSSLACKKIYLFTKSKKLRTPSPGEHVPKNGLFAILRTVMEETTVGAEVVLRNGASIEPRIIAEFINSVDTKTSLQRPAYVEMALRRAPSELPLPWRDECQYVAERGGALIAHFLVLHVEERHQFVHIVCAFSGHASQDEIKEAFQAYLDLLFRHKHLHKVCLLVDLNSDFFFTIAQRLSLYLEGTLRKHLALDGEWYDVALFAQTVEDREQVDRGPPVQGPLREEKYEWLVQQARYDKVHLGVVRAIILRAQRDEIRVLLLKKAEGTSFSNLEEPPGGRILEKESLQDALKRVVHEQTGLSISDDIYYLTAFDFTTDAGERVREFVFRVKPKAWDVVVHPKEHESFSWVLLQDLPSSHLHPDLIQVLSSYSPTLSYETEGVPIHEHEAIVELVRPPSLQLEEVLLVGHHLDAYAAKGLSMIEPIGLILRNSANRIVGGLTAELAYGCLSICRIWVDPAWRLSGWGRKLIARAESIARERGCDFATTFVMDWEYLPFFQKLGYIIEGQYTGYQNASRQFRFRKSLT